MRSSQEFRPRNGHCLQVINLRRISTEHQDEKSLDDQARQNREYIERSFNGSVEYLDISSRGSGEHLDRNELRQLEEAIESQQYDAVIVEDLARICRRNRAYDICELCEDCDTRLIAINDRIDTADPGWRDMASMATWHHERSNRDTSDRIKRTLRGRFEKGEALANLIAGYHKPEGAKHESQITRDPAYIPIYEEWFTRLENGQSFEEIADWLNERGIPLGPHCRDDKWSGTIVGRYTRNPLLKGIRQRNRLVTRRVNRTGRHRNYPAPPEMLMERHCPNLQFIDPERFDRVNRMLEERNSRYRRGRANGRDVRHGVPRKRTRWPGQHLRCGICGRKYVYGGNGRKEFLICEGARRHFCWNGFTINGQLTARRTAEAIRNEVEQIEGFDAAFTAMISEEAKALDTVDRERETKLRNELKRIEREVDNLTNAIAQVGISQPLTERLQSTERDRNRIGDEIATLERHRRRNQIVLPGADELRKLAVEAFDDLPIESSEFWRLMRSLVPKIHVYPYQLIDGGHPVLRASARLNLLSFITTEHAEDHAVPNSTRQLVVDLFDPPQREKYRTSAVKLVREQKMTLKSAAQELGITDTAVQRAMKLQRQLDERQLTDPFVPVKKPIDNDHLCRHRHRRFDFRPLSGFEKPEFPPPRS